MFEIVKVIIEKVLSSFNPKEIAEMRKDDKLKKIGADFYLLYIQLNEIIICGYKIISTLEFYLSQMEKETSSNQHEHDILVGLTLKGRIRKQTRNLVTFWQQANRLATKLMLLDTNLYLHLYPLVSAKSKVLNKLLTILSNQSLPILGPTESEISSIDYSTITEQIHFKSIHLLSDWDADVYEKLKMHFEERRPRETLKELEGLMGKLRTVIEENFSVKDLLLEAREEDLDTDFFGAKYYLEEG